MLALALANGAGAAEVPAVGNDASPSVMDGVASSFSTPWDDLLIGRNPSEWLNASDGLSVGLSVNIPLSRSSAAATGSGTQGPRNTNATTQLSLKYSPLSYWFVATTLYAYFRPSLQQSWNPDFSYVFGYDDWHPYTFSLVYANYGGNRFRPDRAKGQSITNFNEGSWSLGWKFPLPAELGPVFLLDPEDSVGCVAAYNYVPRYFVSGSPRTGKQAATLSCKYSLPDWWFVSATIYVYPFPDQQQAWNPDYTYSFGRFDWHSGEISVQYSNYSGNRWPGRTPAPDTGQFKNGSIGVSWSASF